MRAYCIKCQNRVDIKDAQEIKLKKGFTTGEMEPVVQADELLSPRAGTYLASKLLQAFLKVFFRNPVRLPLG